MTEAPTLRFEVVIAGGGFAGVYAAKALARALGTQARTRVALLADQNFMVFQPMLAEVVGSSVSPRHVVNPIRRLCGGVSIFRSQIVGIDLPNRRLTATAGAFTRNVTVEFDHLALALGSIVDVSRVPGMPEHAFLLKNVGDALELRTAVIDRFEEACLQSDPALVRRLLTFVVVGGGYSGVETAGQLFDLAHGVNRLYPRIAQEDFRVVLVHSRDRLLPEVSPTLGRYCETTMRARGIELVLNERVNAMTASRVFLSGGGTIDAYTVISTVGNAPHPLIGAFCESNGLATQGGRIVTDRTMQVPGQQCLWAAGDCAAVPFLPSEKTEGEAPKDACPPTAQFAYRQGSLLGRNIAASLGKRAPEPFAFRGLGELATIGHRAAVAEILGFRFSGFIAWFLWRTIYLLKLPGTERKLRVMIDWTLDLFFPRDITLLRPRPTEVIQQAHLEKGDKVFDIGDPALSLYIVKSGQIELKDENGVVRALGPGEHFGERALMHDKIWRFSAVATGPTELVSLSDRIFQTISRASPSIHQFFEHSASRFISRKETESLMAALPAGVEKLLVKDLMQSKSVVMNPDLTLREALRLVVAHPYNSFPLVASDGKVMGLVSQSDIYDALRLPDVALGSRLGDLDISTCATVLPETTIPDAVERFYRSGRNKLLVVDDQGRLQGILTPIDLLTAPEQVKTG